MEAKIKWYKKGWVLWALLIFVPYIGVPFMWITKKDFTVKKKVILSIVFTLWFIIVIGMGNSNSETPNANASNPSSSVSESNKGNSENENKKDSSDASSTSEKEDLPDIPLADDFEKSIWIG